MATTTIRWACAKHVLDLLRSHPSMGEALVEAGWPGEDNFRPDTVYLDQMTGTLQIPVGTGGRKHRDDTFDIPLRIRVVNRPDLDATQTRLSEIFAAIEDVLANDPTLDDFDSVRSAEVTEETHTAGQRPDGWTGYGLVVITVHARLT